MNDYGTRVTCVFHHMQQNSRSHRIFIHQNPTRMFCSFMTHTYQKLRILLPHIYAYARCASLKYEFHFETIRPLWRLSGQPLNCDLFACSADAAQRDGHWWNQEVHQQATLGRSRRYMDHHLPGRARLDGVSNTRLRSRRSVEMSGSELPQMQHE